MVNSKQKGVKDLPISLTFRVYGEPVPAARPRVTRRGTYTPKKYMEYKNKLTKQFYQEGFNPLIPPPGHKLRTKWLNENRYCLYIVAYCSRRGLDVDNLAKSIMDALQDAFVIGNDSQIDILLAKKYIDKDNPRVELRLQTI